MDKKVILLMLLMAVVLGGCSLGGSQTGGEIGGLPSTLTGTILTNKGAGAFVMQTDAGLVEVHSGNVALDNYVGQKVSVSGEYSGTTLYVDEIQ